MLRASSAPHRFAQALGDRDEISITVTGRKTGRAITLPVWFTLARNTLYLLPVRGSRTQWYRNVLAKPVFTVRAGRRRLTATGHPVKGRAAARPIVSRFRQKYTDAEIARYYRGVDVAVKVPLGRLREEPRAR